MSNWLDGCAEPSNWKARVPIWISNMVGSAAISTDSVV